MIYKGATAGALGTKPSTCRICGCSGDFETYLAREMMQGTKEEFEYFICENCQCLQLKETPANLGDFYGSDYYSFSDKKWTPSSTFEQPVTQFDKILDVGCGSGRWLLQRAKEGYGNLFGCDPFLEHDITYGDRVHIQNCSIHEMTGDHSFDMIWFQDSFEHMEDPKEALISAKRLLKEGGVLAMTLPVFPNLAFDNFGTNWYQLDAPRHIFLHSLKSLSYLSEQAGLQIFEITYDSNNSQFIRSALYEEDIPFHDQTAEKIAAHFTKDDWNELEQLSQELNEKNYGDHATLYMGRRMETL